MLGEVRRHAQPVRALPRDPRQLLVGALAQLAVGEAVISLTLSLNTY